jgi:hypothetical protein
MVDRIKYTTIAGIVAYFKNVHKVLGPIECTSMVTRIAMNLGCPEMANLAYIEGDVPIFGLEHFVHVHILREEPDYSVPMLYGHKAIWLPNPAPRLYSCKSLTLQFDQMERRAIASQDHLALTGELVWRQHNRSRLHHRLTLRSPSGTLGMGLATRVTMRVVVTIPLTVTPSLACEPEPLPLPGTLTGTLLWSGTSVMGLTRLSSWWKGSDDSSDG